MHITRKLRRELTPWERKLWSFLRNRGLSRKKFRRQVKIGKYVVDFCCLNHKLVIELDGSQHAQNCNLEPDKGRQRFLEKQGFKVLRFWNNEIENNLEGVYQKIQESLETGS